MIVERIDCLVFGYRKITVSVEDMARVTTKLLQNGVSIIINRSGSFTIRERVDALISVTAANGAIVMLGPFAYLT